MTLLSKPVYSVKRLHRKLEIIVGIEPFRRWCIISKCIDPSYGNVQYFPARLILLCRGSLAALAGLLA